MCGRYEGGLTEDGGRDFDCVLRARSQGWGKRLVGGANEGVVGESQNGGAVFERGVERSVYTRDSLMVDLEANERVQVIHILSIAACDFLTVCSLMDVRYC